MILDRFKLTDKVAIVTGAGRGIGQGIAWAFAEAGADVAVGARSADQLAETVAGIEKRGRRGLAVPTDVLENEDLDALVQETLDRFGRIDVLVNNAGGSPPREALKTSQAFFERAIHFNTTQAFLLTQKVVPHMVRTAGGGAIVNIGSRAGSMPQKAFVAYGTAKAALIYMTKLLAQEWAPKVRVNVIAVGGVATSALEVVITDANLKRTFEEKTPMGRIGEVEDIAACALYLASPASSWVTGKVFEVDGGTEATALEVPTTPL
jgi:7-alpha-hydroxysteroid dehydrogenase